jgi:hypothetical protein
MFFVCPATPFTNLNNSDVKQSNAHVLLGLLVFFIALRTSQLPAGLPLWHASCRCCFCRCHPPLLSLSLALMLLLLLLLLCVLRFRLITTSVLMLPFPLLLAFCCC